MKLRVETVRRCTLGKLVYRTLQKRVKEHKYAVQRYDVKNGIAVHAWSKEHRVDWDSARVVALAPYTWERCVTEALHIRQQASTMNLDCGLHISPIRNPILDHPSTPIPESTNPPTSPDYPWLGLLPLYLKSTLIHARSLCHHYITTCI